MIMLCNIILTASHWLCLLPIKRPKLNSQHIHLFDDFTLWYKKEKDKKKQDTSVWFSWM